MKEEIRYLRYNIKRCKNSLEYVGKMLAQFPDYVYSQQKLTEELKVLKSIFQKVESLPLELKAVDKLEKGDVFLWRSWLTERYEVHTFHSDAGYGAKTFTDYNEKDGSSLIVNYSGICGVIRTINSKN